jgi:predicted metal-binding membrane protein
MQAKALTQRPAQAALAAVAVAAWLALVVMEQQVGGLFAGHAAAHAFPAGAAGAPEGGLAGLASFTAAWAVMVVAMMLPVAMPLAAQVSAPAGRPPGGVCAVPLLLGGYVLAWTAFGVGAHLVLQASLNAAGLAPGADALVGPAALVVAGAYQLTPLKRRAAHRACSPPPFTGPGGESWLRWAGVALHGAREGAVCIGCCWALMLVMLAGAAGGPGGMLALGAIMWAERNAPWGWRLVTPVGLFFIWLGVALGCGSLLGVFPWLAHSY